MHRSCVAGPRLPPFDSLCESCESGGRLNADADNGFTDCGASANDASILAGHNRSVHPCRIWSLAAALAFSFGRRLWIPFARTDAKFWIGRWRTSLGNQVRPSTSPPTASGREIRGVGIGRASRFIQLLSFMPDTTYRALVLDRSTANPGAVVQSLPLRPLQADHIRVAVAYSDLNYKDALILTGRWYTNLAYPLVPGIDLAGAVVESRCPEFTPGQRVVLTGAGLGETRPGGYSEMTDVVADALLPLPDSLSPRAAMEFGTAGFAAALAVLALEEGGIGTGRSVVVTGAGGGVGSIAVALLAERGYRVSASAGRVETHSALRAMGAVETIGRLDPPAQPLGTERWAAAIDTVGGVTLDAVARRVGYGGVVASTGFSGGFTTNLHLAPLLLRNVRLQGVNTSACPLAMRRRAWNLLADTPRRSAAEQPPLEIGLSEIPHMSEELLAGALRMRVLVNVHR